MRISRILSPFFSLALLMATPIGASACKCAFVDTPKQAFGKAYAVFAGKVSKLQRTKSDNHVLVQVSQVWKGDVKQIVTVNGGLSSCKVWFLKDQRYLIYAYGKKDPSTFHTHICTRTKLFKTAKEDLKFLGKGKAPQKK